MRRCAPQVSRPCAWQEADHGGAVPDQQQRPAARLHSQGVFRGALHCQITKPKSHMPTDGPASYRQRIPLFEAVNLPLGSSADVLEPSRAFVVDYTGRTDAFRFSTTCRQKSSLPHRRTRAQLHGRPSTHRQRRFQLHAELALRRSSTVPQLQTNVRWLPVARA